MSGIANPFQKQSAPAARRALAMILCLALTPAGAAGTGDERRAKPVVFAKGQTSAVITGRIEGRHYVDHTLHAAAGQTLAVRLKAASRSAYFNLLPPGSPDAAMAIGEFSDNQFSGLLPDDGTYTIRVFLNRAAARRNAASNYGLRVGLGGTALKPLPAAKDALVPGTRFHARATVPCAPAYTQVRECTAGVVRRGFDGTATVELGWDDKRKRRILFVKGEARASDVPQAMRSTRHERGWTIEFDGGERFEIPEPLVMGG
ncbi:MAG: hypothetical protein IPM03_06915 [Sulfuritalea sp.]|nr:hypothetical protein [Sulfuritalea sp.]